MAEIINPTSFVAGNTYMITEELTFNTDIVFPPNVTLIFRGGTIKLTSSFKKITGDKTKIVAPIEQIFVDVNEVAGSWDIDRAYPQWLGANTANTDEYNGYGWSSLCDSSNAINNAIRMKGVGEVYLRRGYYKIKNPINVPVGIQLNGDKGMSFVRYGNQNDPDEPNRSFDENICDGTVLVADGFLDQFSGNSTNHFMVYVNAKVDGYQLKRITKGEFLAGQVTCISNLCFTRKNWTGDTGLVQPSYSLDCIFSATTVKIDNVRFENFIQAVYFNMDNGLGKTYYDVKSITNCDYHCSNIIENFNVNEDDKKFAFDLGYLGDALIFEHNAIHNGKFNKGVRVTCCGGGRIASNIINADILIDRSQAMTISNNHIEYGHVITINCSSVNTCNNYIERGHKTPVVLSGNSDRDKAIVTMNKDTFIFIENPRDYNEGNEGTSANPNYQVFQYRLANASEYDIAIDENAVVSLNQVYRYRICNLAGKVYPTGIKICKLDGTPIDAFNNFSYMLSQKGVISCNYNVDKNFIVSRINNVNVYAAMKNGWVYWLAPSGKYLYKYQVVYDFQRKLLATRNNSQLFSIANMPNMSDGLIENSDHGVLLVLNDNNGNSARATIRLFRKKGESWNDGTDFQYVDIPNTNNHFFYDNGISINGYRWKAATNSMILTGATGLESITFQGDNVVCRISGNQSVSNWQSGDVLVKTGTTPSIEVIG